MLGEEIHSVTLPTRIIRRLSESYRELLIPLCRNKNIEFILSRNYPFVKKKYLFLII